MSHRLCRPIAVLLALTLAASAALAERVTVFAAVSLTEALEAVAKQFEAATGHQVVLSLAGSSVLARQIERGAPANIFISANPDWMDALTAEGLIVEDTRRVVAGNQLALVSHAAGAPQEVGQALDLPGLLDGGRLAMALVEAVPAGIYGRAALVHLGLWDGVAPQVAQADNVRAALALVATGEAPLGVVYASDAEASARVHLLGLFPPDSHPPIRYPAAIVAGADSAAARAFLDHLSGAQAAAVFAAHGFAPPGP